jgi:hypothetical protein
MLDADWGIVADKTIDITDSFSLTPSFGYSWRCDGLNGATFIGSGTEVLNRGEKNTVTTRVSSLWQINDDVSLSLGGSVLAGGMRHPTADKQVALDADAVLCAGPLTATVEYVYYDQDYPKDNDFARGNILLLEGYLELYRNNKSKFLRAVALNYNYSKDMAVRGDGLGRLHLPSLCVEINNFIKIRFAYADWRSEDTPIHKSWWLNTNVSF